MAAVDRVLIVGGGIGGLTLATALHRHGLAAELVERAPAWRAVGAGLAVQPNGVRVLRALGLGPAVEAAGAPIRHWEFCDVDGAPLSVTDLEALWGDVGPFLGVERARLQQVLRCGAAPVPARLDTSIAELREEGSRVAVRFDDGTAGEYALVVGADGIASAVRRLALGGDPPCYAGQMVWRGVAPVRPRGLTRLRFLLGDGCFFGLCPVGDGRTYGFANLAGPRTHDPEEGRLARVRQRFAAFGGGAQEFLGALERDDQLHCSAVEWVEREAWGGGRVVLIGDAAHASSPMMGQGGSLAMEDAWVLAESLRAAPTVEAAVAEYVARRAPRVQWVREQSAAAAAALRLPAAQRDEVLRERGDAAMQARFAPLRAEP